MNIGEMKYRAKQKMKKDRAVILGVSLSFIILTTCLSQLATYSDWAFGWLIMMVEVFIGIGLVSFFLNIVKTGNANLGIIKVSPEAYFRYVGYTILIGVISAIIAIIVYIPIVFSGVFLIYYSFGSILTKVLLLVLLLLILLFGVILFELFFFCTKYLIVEGNTLPDSFKGSIKMMKGYKGKLFLAQLSFIGWGLLVLITCGIYAVWFIPYYEGTMAEFYLELKNQLNEKQSQSSFEKNDNDDVTEVNEEDIIVENTVFDDENKSHTTVKMFVDPIEEEILEEEKEKDE